MVETEDGLVDDGTAETEVKFRLPRGSDPGPEGVPKDIPIVTGAVGAEATPTRAPKRNGPHMNCPPHQSRDQAGSARKGGPFDIRNSLGNTFKRRLVAWGRASDFGS